MLTKHTLLIMNEFERLNKFIAHLKNERIVYTNSDFAEQVGIGKSSISEFINGKRSLTDSFVSKLEKSFPFLNIDWLLTGKGNMLNDEHTEHSSGNLIPLYDDVVTIGGTDGMVALMDGVSSEAAEYIDTGDWFREATAAIRHYGYSMVEYPQGCILAIKEVFDRQLIMPGRDYVIETSEYRVTKRVQRGKDEEHLALYSTNAETYPDGRMIHEPFEVHLSAIRHIWLVLGYVVKTNGGTVVYSKK